MQIHLTMEIPDYSLFAQGIGGVIIGLIFISTISFVMETVPDYMDWSHWFTIEAVVSTVFTIEYLLRIGTVKNPFKFSIRLLNIIDLLAVVPFFLDIIFQSTDTNVVQVFRVVRLVRIFRIFKMSRYSTYMQVMGTAVSNSADALGVLTFFLGIAVIVFSSLMYYAERGVYDPVLDEYIRSDGSPSPFTSIPATFYWCIVTMTTVGYGDVVPVEFGGI